MKKNQILLLACGIILTSLVSCKENSTPSLTPSILPTQPRESYTPIPKPEMGTSIILGVLKVEHTNQPMSGVELFLANHIGSTTDTPLYNLEPDSAPHAIVDSRGQFVFKNVKPGRYTIVVWNPFNSFLLRDPQTGFEFVIEVQPDQVYNIGTFYEPHP
ncbi:MAG: carboxypeptidase-like regulatory domain-containing protein [Candidatus Methanomethylicaceae archaeon]